VLTGFAVIEGGAQIVSVAGALSVNPQPFVTRTVYMVVAVGLAVYVEEIAPLIGELEAPPAAAYH
jgi:hypothetical protein